MGKFQDIPLFSGGVEPLDLAISRNLVKSKSRHERVDAREVKF
jgi:hypothetical protein